MGMKVTVVCRKGDTVMHTLVPVRYAITGLELVFKMHGKWDPGWLVEEVRPFDFERPEEEEERPLA